MAKRRDERPSRRPRTDRRTRPGSAGGIVDARLLEAIHRIDAGGFRWEDVAEDVLPVFERARPFPFQADPPALAVVPPGVTVGFGVDAGPAYMRVSGRHLAGWPIDLDGLTEQALENLRHRARLRDARDVRLGAIDGRSVDLFQSGDGWASTAVLLPTAMRRLFGPQPGLFIAPWRDLLVRLPHDVDVAFATWLSEELESEDANALRLEAFEWRDGTIRCRPLERATLAV